jgi:hypothetical protein
MDPDVQTFAQVSMVIVMLVGSLSAIGVVTWKVLARKSAPPRNALQDEKLDQLQQSVDAIAIEVERIAEAQRFTAKLMAEQPERTSLPR